MISSPNFLARANSSSAIRAIAVLAENFDQHAGGLQSGHPGQVDGAFGVPGAAQHAPFLGHQRIEMARPNEIRGLGLRIDDLLDRSSPAPAR